MLKYNIKKIISTYDAAEHQKRKLYVNIWDVLYFVPVNDIMKKMFSVGSVKLKCPERVNLLHARRKLWSPSEELLTRNQKNENQV
jgi:hypothetical protein